MRKQSRDDEPSSVNIPCKRRQLLKHLDEVLEKALDKYTNPRTANVQCQGWGRVIDHTVEMVEKILQGVEESEELEEVKARLEKLENLANKRITEGS